MLVALHAFIGLRSTIHPEGGAGGGAFRRRRRIHDDNDDPKKKLIERPTPQTRVLLPVRDMS